MAKETILVVDDEANIIELARMYLQNEGYVVESARDGREALVKIKSIRPALVVLDLMLPEVDGWEVCRQVRTDQEALPPLIGDNDRLAQVFTNLIDNALKHTSQGGRVTVAAREVMSQPGRKGEKAVPKVEVGVADTGSGIPPEDLPRIFERFYQVDKSRRREGKGAGLGLAIAKEIVQAHGGQIKAESLVGVGNKFTVTLPASDGD